VALLTSGTASGSGTTLTITGVTCAAGNVVEIFPFAVMTGNNPITVLSVTDSVGGNLWNIPAAANTGAFFTAQNQYAGQATAWCQPKNALSSATITVTFSVSAAFSASDYGTWSGVAAGAVTLAAAASAVLASVGSQASPSVQAPNGALVTASVSVNGAASSASNSYALLTSSYAAWLQTSAAGATATTLTLTATDPVWTVTTVAIGPPPAPAGARGPARARIAALLSRGRSRGSPGTFGQAGPAIYPPHGPAGLGRRGPGPFRRGRSQGSTGAPVSNPAPAAGPPLIPPRGPAGLGRRAPGPFRKGRTQGSTGTSGILGPAIIPPKGAAGLSRRAPVPFRKGRAQGSPGGPVLNPAPAAGPPITPPKGPAGLGRRAPGPFRFGRGRGNPGGPNIPPAQGPPVIPPRGPAGLVRRAAGPWRKGRSRGNPGAPVLNPAPAPDIVSPPWLAARNGLPADSTAVNHAAQIGQFLAAHGITVTYQGTQIVTPSGDVGFGLGNLNPVSLAVDDVDQPFTMPAGKTAIGRVQLPLAPAGAGADVTVSLYTSSAGVPGTLITSTRVPAAWLAQLAATEGLASGGPLATSASNILLMNDLSTFPWPAPASGGTDGAVYPALAVSGNYVIMAGGYSPSGSGTAVPAVTTAGFLGGTTLDRPAAQPPLPKAATAGAFAVTTDTLVYAGGISGTGSSAPFSNVWTAGWDPTTGTVSAWSAQQALPVAISPYGASAAWGETVYITGGYDAAADLLATVYYATVSNGQITAWNSGPPLPVGTVEAAVGVVGNWLIVAGGLVLVGSSQVPTSNVWYAAINPDGSLGAWRAGPPLPQRGGAGAPWMVTSAGLMVPSGTGYLQTLTVTEDGPAPEWQTVIASGFGNWPAAAFDLGGGQWQAFIAFSTTYETGTLSSVPYLSVPLPATGLTAGGTYHIVVHQDGGDLNDYATITLEPNALPTAANTRPAGGGSWTGQPDQYAVFLGVYDQTPGGSVLHTWEDSGARITSLIYAGASNQVLGLCEATAFADGTTLPAVTQVTYDGAVPVGTVQLA
jgi:hypothetical protein